MKKNKTTEQKMLDGKPATQKNVTVQDEKFELLEKSERLKYMSFSAYVNKLIDEDLVRVA